MNTSRLQVSLREFVALIAVVATGMLFVVPTLELRLGSLCYLLSLSCTSLSVAAATVGVLCAKRLRLRRVWRAVFLVLPATAVWTVMLCVTNALHDAYLTANERSAVEACKTFVQAEQNYAGRYFEYAQSLHDLYETQPGMADLAFISRGLMRAEYAAGAMPCNGYFFKILTAQSNNAPGGRTSYLSGRRMTRGFALVAWPSEYGITGQKIFTIGKEGIVLEMSELLYPRQAAEEMTEYDPPVPCPIGCCCE